MKSVLFQEPDDKQKDYRPRESHDQGSNEPHRVETYRTEKDSPYKGSDDPDSHVPEKPETPALPNLAGKPSGENADYQKTEQTHGVRHLQSFELPVDLNFFLRNFIFVGGSDREPGAPVEPQKTA